MSHTKAHEISGLRLRVARLSGAAAAGRTGPTVGFGVPAIDHALPDIGLRRALHEVAGAAAEVEHGGAAALFVAGALARHAGPVLWVMEWPDLYAPALAAAGLSPQRVIYVEAGRHVLAAMEEGLRAGGLAGVVGEANGRVTLTASRRLQLAAEAYGVPAFLLRRSRSFNDPRLQEPSAAATRWRLASLPSPPPVVHAPDVPGLSRALWRLDLIRCRGGEAASWIVEACDAQGRLRLVSDLLHRPAAEDRRSAGAGGPLRHFGA
jgi:protein ImuA